MKVLFIGGTGIISTACTALAAQRGTDLYVLNRGRPGATPLPAGVRTLHADVHQPDQIEATLRGHRWDAVVNFINFVPADIERDIRLFAGKTSQYVFISSASVYQKPPAHYLITEQTPLSNPYWDYAQNKIACEHRLMDEHAKNGFPVTLVRPSLTYGPTLIPLVMNSWARSWTVADRILRGRPVVVPGDGTSLWVTTHNTDFAKGLLGLLGQARAVGEAFHITSDEVLTWDQHYRALGAALGVEPKITHLTTDAIATLFPDRRGSLLGDKSHSVAFDNSKIKSFVPDFAATVTFREGMRRAVSWFRESPSRMEIDVAQNAMLDRLVAAAGAAIEAPAHSPG